MTSDPTIGILAGMGPRSTAPFLERVLDECVRQYGATLDADFPPMMIYSLPTPFTLDGPLDHDAMRRSIRRGLERLAGTGVAIIAIPCNVAHRYFDHVVRDIEVPVLHLIDVTAAAIPGNVGAVAVLATRPTHEAGLYQRALRSRSFRLAPPDALQSRVDRLIGGVKGSWPAERLNDEWGALVARLREMDVDCAVLGSTDLAAVPAAAREDRLGVVDSGSALARELVARWRAAGDGENGTGTPGSGEASASDDADGV